MKVLDNYQCEGQMSIFDMLSRDSSFGKMYQEPYLREPKRAQTSDVCLKKFAELRIKPPQYLCLKRGSGLQAGASWEKTNTDKYIAFVGEYTMRSFGEYPNEERESLLSQILEDHPHQKYCLSAKACQGILNRANKRGKQLPQILEQALTNQIHTLSKLGGGCERDSSGKKAGKGALIQTELSGTLGDSQDQTLITKCLNSWDVQSKHIQPENGKAESLYSGECRYGGGESYVMQSISIGNGQLHDAESPSVEVSKTLNCMDDPMKIITIEGNGSRESHRGNGYKESDVMYSLNTVEQHGVCYGLDRASFNQGQNAQYDFSVQEEIAQTLVAKGPGGGTSETVGALCASDSKGVGNQYVNDGKIIIQRI